MATTRFYSRVREGKTRQTRENKKGCPDDTPGHVAERTGLEPATPGVTGRYSNHLNYRSKNDDLKSLARLG
jgi:hypothetical protein